jgi:hypothetical protein
LKDRPVGNRSSKRRQDNNSHRKDRLDGKEVNWKAWRDMRAWISKIGGGQSEWQEKRAARVCGTTPMVGKSPESVLAVSAFGRRRGHTSFSRCHGLDMHWKTQESVPEED